MIKIFLLPKKKKTPNPTQPPHTPNEFVLWSLIYHSVLPAHPVHSIFHACNVCVCQCGVCVRVMKKVCNGKSLYKFDNQPFSALLNCVCHPFFPSPFQPQPASQKNRPPKSMRSKQNTPPVTSRI